MKKFLAVLLCAAMAASLAACSGQNGGGSGNSGGSADANTPSENTSEQAEHPAEPAEAGSSETSGTGKTLVVYFSATNNTEAVAGYIADATGADLFELVPTKAYTSDDLDWTNEDSRVSREHDDESLRVVELEKAVPDNWDEYDTVFIGYPIWWGIAAWPTDTFVKANDFSGKTVIPFCTSATSGLGESGELLKEEAGTGDWLEGQRFRSGASEDDVKAWVSGLEL